MVGGKKITCYLDCVSPYSRFGMLHLQRQSAALAHHGVDIEFVPIFLGGVNHGSGNKPPWTLPAKANHSPYDLARAMKYFDAPKMRRPDCFPIVSLLPQRAMCYIKHVYSKAVYTTIFSELWVGLWEENTDISDPKLLATILSRHLALDEVETLIAAAQSAQWKDALNRNTQQALARGAYGAPWYWVSDGQGKEEPFFGSDRFHFMWDFLQVPHRDFEVLKESPASL